MHESLCRCPLTFRGPLASIHLATMPTSNYRPYHLLGLEEEDGTVTQIEVDEMFRLVRDEAAKVPSHNAVPGWTLPFVELTNHISTRSQQRAPAGESVAIVRGLSPFS
jgi:hypothetical protein